MDFLQGVNNRLLEPTQPKSRLLPYFDACMLFQPEYHSPPPSPPSSPEPETPIVNIHTQHPPSARKRKFEPEWAHRDEDLKRKRTRRATAEIHAAPSPPTTDDSPPLSPRSRRSSFKDTDTNTHYEHSRSKRIRVSTSAAPSPPTSPEPDIAPDEPVAPSPKRRRLNSPAIPDVPTSENLVSLQVDSVKVGRYSLRRTAVRVRRTNG